MMQLKATKTSLYNFITCYEPLPEMRKTEFIKAIRARSWWLKWYDGELYCKAYFSTCAGRALLSIEKYIDGAYGIQMISRKVYNISLDDLRARGMIEEKE